VAVILKAREPARIMIAIGDKAVNRWHLQIAERWVVQYNFYINNQDRGGCSCASTRTFRSPPVSASISTIGWPTACVKNGVRFKHCSNAFLKCAEPDRLQELADSLTPRDLVTCGQKWLAHLTPFFSARESEHGLTK
jgi:hypothetical protein